MPEPLDIKDASYIPEINPHSVFGSDHLSAINALIRAHNRDRQNAIVTEYARPLYVPEYRAFVIRWSGA